MMVLSDGYVLLRRVGDSVHITELSHDEVAPRRRIVKLERFLSDMLPEHDEPMRDDADSGGYWPGAASNRSFDR